MERTVFVVDDGDINLEMAREALKDYYRVLTFESASKMFSFMDKVTPDLILLDIEMTEISGFDALIKLKQDPVTADIPVAFLTGMTDTSFEVRGFQLGVVDFITKPFYGPALVKRLQTHLNIDDLIRERTALLQKKTLQLESLQNGIVLVLADMVENRDQITGGHIERTTLYIRILVDEMIRRGIYLDTLENVDYEQFVTSARLHDIGKIAISDAILNKPGRFTDEEFAIMKTHVAEGVRIIEQIISRTEEVGFLRYAKLFAGYHHERWDGKGYPNGLHGDAIPVHGLIMAIADVYDALVTERPYKKAFTPDEAASIIMEGSGTQFNPQVAEAFYCVRHHFGEVSLLRF